VLIKLSKKSGDAQLYTQAAKIMVASKKLIVFTGAGMSTESSIPDFRGPGGLWTRYDPVKVASIDAFRSDPKAWWEWISSLGSDVLEAAPNKGHLAIAELEKLGKIDCVITQNIDGLHQRAGNSCVLELHGSVATAKCTQCRSSYPREYVMDLIKMGEMPPRCDVCSGILKLDVVLFGEPLPQIVFREATERSNDCDAMLVAGSSLVVYPAAVLPKLAKDHGAKIIMVNLEPTDFDKECDVVIRGKVGGILPKLVEACKAEISAKK
jgi:NAD-dependent deacetylase